jgi:hypothetical protein
MSEASEGIERVTGAETRQITAWFTNPLPSLPDDDG